MQDERAELTQHIIEATSTFTRRQLPLGGEREWMELDLTMPQLKTLLVVAASDGLPMSQIARWSGMTMSTATGVADRLIAHGLVRREHDPADRRVVMLCATEAGLALVDRLTRISEEIILDVLDRLSIAELGMVVASLDVLYRAINDVMRERFGTRERG